MPVAALTAPEELTAKSPLLILRVLPCKAPVEVTVPPWTAALVVIALAVLIAPKPEAILPLDRAPTPVMAAKAPL
jgi:hypothetical protein